MSNPTSTSNTTQDFGLTILWGSRPTDRLTKVWLPGQAKARGYPRIRWHYHEEVQARTIDELHHVITLAESNPRCCCVRGRVRAEHRERQLIRRTLHVQKDGYPGTIEDVARRWVCLDLDDLPTPPGLDPATAP